MDSASGGGRTSSTPRGVKSGNMGLVKFQSVAVSFVRVVGPPALTTPSQRTAPLPSVKSSTVLSTRSLGLSRISGYSIISISL